MSELLEKAMQLPIPERIKLVEDICQKEASSNRLMLPVKLLDAAEAEMADAITWYEEHKPGLGSAFRVGVETTIDSIANSPFAYPVVWLDRATGIS